jgi:PAS domain S-box-containing protein
MNLSPPVFEEAFENSAMGMALIAPGGRFLRVNRAWCAILGYEEADLLATTAQALIDPEDSEAWRRAVERLVAGATPFFRLEKRYLHKDGTSVWTETTAAVVRAADGQPSYFIAQIQDITERRILAEQYRQAQRMEAIGQLAGGVAHDFNNLLTIITGYTDLLLGGADQGDPRRGFLEEVMKAAQRAASLTRQLLAFSRRQILAPVVLSLHDLVADMETMFRRFLRENIEVVSSLEPALWRVKADRAQIEQVLLNLAINAGDSMPAGGTLTLTTANVVLDESKTRSQPNVPPGRYVKVSMTDTGCGMDENTRAHLFEPFFTTKDISKGIGLGLATVYGIIKQSGGHIDVRSEVRSGTTFDIYLPALPDDASGHQFAAAQSQDARSQQTILLVEDDAGVRFLVRDVLAQEGYTVLEACDGQEALRLCGQSDTPIHLVLTDVVMPMMSGRQLRDRVSQLRPDLKFVYMSGYTDDAVVLEQARADEIRFLHKPFTPETLTREVREALDD